MKKLICMILAIVVVLVAPLQTYAGGYKGTSWCKDEEDYFPIITNDESLIKLDPIDDDTRNMPQACGYLCRKTGKYTIKIDGLYGQHKGDQPGVKVELRKIKKGAAYETNKYIKGPKDKNGDEESVRIVYSPWMIRLTAEYNASDKGREWLEHIRSFDGYRSSYKKTVSLRKGEILLVCMMQPFSLKDGSTKRSEYRDTLYLNVSVKSKKK